MPPLGAPPPRRPTPTTRRQHRRPPAAPRWAPRSWPPPAPARGVLPQTGGPETLLLVGGVALARRRRCRRRRRATPRERLTACRPTAPTGARPDATAGEHDPGAGPRAVAAVRGAGCCAWSPSLVVAVGGARLPGASAPAWPCARPRPTPPRLRAELGRRRPRRRRAHPSVARGPARHVAREHSDGLLWAAATALPVVGDDADAVRRVRRGPRRAAARALPGALDAARALQRDPLRGDDGAFDLAAVRALRAPVAQRRAGAARRADRPSRGRRRRRPGAARCRPRVGRGRRTRSHGSTPRCSPSARPRPRLLPGDARRRGRAALPAGGAEQRRGPRAPVGCPGRSSVLTRARRPVERSDAGQRPRRLRPPEPTPVAPLTPDERPLSAPDGHRLPRHQHHARTSRAAASLMAGSPTAARPTGGRRGLDRPGRAAEVLEGHRPGEVGRAAARRRQRGGQAAARALPGAARTTAPRTPTSPGHQRGHPRRAAPAERSTRRPWCAELAGGRRSSAGCWCGARAGRAGRARSGDAGRRRAAARHRRPTRRRLLPQRRDPGEDPVLPALRRGRVRSLGCTDDGRQVVQARCGCGRRCPTPVSQLDRLRQRDGDVGRAGRRPDEPARCTPRRAARLTALPRRREAAPASSRRPSTTARSRCSRSAGPGRATEVGRRLHHPSAARTATRGSQWTPGHRSGRRPRPWPEPLRLSTAAAAAPV